MHIYIADLLKETHKGESFPKLLQLFYDLNLSAPINRILDDEKYEYKNYRYDLTEIFTNTIIKAILDNLFNKRCGLMPHLEARVSRIYSNSLPSQEAILEKARANSIILLMTNAVRFTLIKLGNCLERSAYSAIALAEIFQGTKVRVALQSMTKVDHVAVTLGPIKGIFYVYDPLINPEIVIPLKEYQDNISPKLPKTEKLLPKVKIEIDGHILQMYQVNKDRIMERIIEQLNVTSTDELWAKSDFQELLVSNGYNQEHLNQARQILEIAIGNLQNSTNDNTRGVVKL